MALAKDSSFNLISLSPAGESDVEKLEYIEQLTADCDAVQRMVLAEILEQNKETEYFRHFGLDGATDRTTFKAKIPVAAYDDLKPYIERIADGDEFSILSGHPITEFLTSSGTSGGERKLMPLNDEEINRRFLFLSLILPVMKQFIPDLEKGKGLPFFFVKSETKTRGGIIARPVLTSLFKNHKFKSAFLSHYTSPLAAIICPDTHQSLYIQMLCGLYLRHQVFRVGSFFPSGLIRSLQFLKNHWAELARDISTGTLSPSITDTSLQDSVVDILRPDPELSRFIHDECSKQDWAGIITRIWPNTKYLDVIISGAMSQYIPTLQLYSGGLPMVTNLYASSECYFGLNLNPLCHPSEISYTIMPNMAYFEFLPVNNGGGDDELVELAAIELGKEYEIVVTTYSGLYRYRVGDVLRVTGFYNSTPHFEFLRRGNVILSIESDKTDEAELQRAVDRVAGILAEVGISVVDYSSHACTETIPGHYVIYLELRRLKNVEKATEAVDRELMEKCCLEMEEEFNAVYRQSRVSDRSIGPLEIRVVRTGTFEKLMDFAISKGTSINQYKVPRCINFKPILELFDSCMVSSHFSTSLPKWTPNRFQ